MTKKHIPRRDKSTPPTPPLPARQRRVLADEVERINAQQQLLVGADGAVHDVPCEDVARRRGGDREAEEDACGCAVCVACLEGEGTVVVELFAGAEGQCWWVEGWRDSVLLVDDAGVVAPPVVFADCARVFHEEVGGEGGDEVVRGWGWSLMRTVRLLG